MSKAMLASAKTGKQSNRIEATTTTTTTATTTTTTTTPTTTTTGKNYSRFGK